MKKVCVVAMLLLSICSTFAQRPTWATETQEQKEKRMAWRTHDRFGMFIHWGLYASPARHEWVQNYEKISNKDYQKYFDIFNPDLYNPKEWAKQAKAAGMKYAVITAKHHEGFCLWDSKYTDFKVTNTPYKKDALKEFVDAMRAEGLRVGFYYSLLDWHHPDFPVDSRHPLRDDKEARAEKRELKKYQQYIKDQLTELLTQYGKIDELFVDYSYPGPDGKGAKEWDSEGIVQLIRKLQPTIILNDRLDLDNTDWGWDSKTPEQFMPRKWLTVDGKKVPWETCQTFSGSWGYYRDENTWKSTAQLLTMLIESVSKGGNLLLNVGPNGRGYIDDRASERLASMGHWMDYNNRSIYGCTQAPEEFKTPANCLMTYNPETKRLYIHVLNWPFKSLHLEGYKGKFKYAQLLHDGSEVKFRTTAKVTGLAYTTETSGENDVIIELPVIKPNVEIPVIEIFLN